MQIFIKFHTPHYFRCHGSVEIFFQMRICRILLKHDIELDMQQMYYGIEFGLYSLQSILLMYSRSFDGNCRTILFNLGTSCYNFSIAHSYSKATPHYFHLHSELIKLSCTKGTLKHNKANMHKFTLTYVYFCYFFTFIG